MVIRYEDESLESLINRFNKQVEKAEIKKDISRTTYYIPKSKREKMKHQKAVNRKRREERHKNV